MCPELCFQQDQTCFQLVASEMTEKRFQTKSSFECLQLQHLFRHHQEVIDSKITTGSVLVGKIYQNLSLEIQSYLTRIGVSKKPGFPGSFHTHILRWMAFLDVYRFLVQQKKIQRRKTMKPKMKPKQKETKLNQSKSSSFHPPPCNKQNHILRGFSPQFHLCHPLSQASETFIGFCKVIVHILGSRLRDLNVEGLGTHHRSVR